MRSGIKNVVYNSLATSVNVGANSVRVTSAFVKSGVVQLHHFSNETISNVFTQVNKYTPDIYDVGGKGNKDLSSDMAYFIIGNSAMIAQNGIRMARMPMSIGLKVASKLLYNQKRMNKLAEIKSTKLETNPALEFRYREILSGRKEKDVVFRKDLYAWNRYEKNQFSNMAMKEKGSILLKKYNAQRYDRLLSRKNGMERYSAYLNKKKFNLKKSVKGTIRNQTRKITNQVVAGNDPSAMANKTFSYTLKATRVANQLWKSRIYLQKFGNVIFHPIKTLKAVMHSIIGLFNLIGTIISTIPVIISFLIMLLPMIFICISLMVFMIWINDIFNRPVEPIYTYEKAILCDWDNNVKNYIDISSIRNRNSMSYKMVYKDEFGQIRYDDLGLAYLEQDDIKWYLVRLGNHYRGGVGERLKITLANAEEIHVIICSKDANAKEGRNYPDKGCLLTDDSMFQFYGKESSITSFLNDKGMEFHLNQNLDEEHKWKSRISRVDYARRTGEGSLDNVIRFDNDSAWKSPSNVYAENFLGQCTWFAWGRFYEIYGYSPEFYGDGYLCVRQLLDAHPQQFKYSKLPYKGAIGSSDKEHNHVFVVEAVKGDKITISEGNLNGKTDVWNDAIHDWRKVTLTKDQLKLLYGNITYAVPRE